MRQNLLNQLLEPTFTSPDPGINLRKGNKNGEEYATRAGERVSDGIRRAIYMNKIAHLMLNQSHLSTAEEKCTKDSDFNPSMVNSESLVDTVIGVGESAMKKPSVGLTHRVHEEQSTSRPVAKRHS